jgi:hypothetical protein
LEGQLSALVPIFRERRRLLFLFHLASLRRRDFGVRLSHLDQVTL